MFIQTRFSSLRMALAIAGAVAATVLTQHAASSTGTSAAAHAAASFSMPAKRTTVTPADGFHW